MARTVFARVLTLSAAALSLLSSIAAGGTPAGAAEVKVLTTSNLMPILEGLTGAFESTTGHKLKIDHAGAAAVRNRVQGGEFADVVIHSRAAINDLLKQTRIRAGSIANVARSSVGVAVRKGADKPDIGSDDALRRTLLAAASIAYPDPAGGSLGGIYFASLVERIGIAEALRPKTKLTGPATATAELVAKGEAELGVNQIEGLDTTLGIELVFPLPPELKGKIVLAAGVAAAARETDAAIAFVKFLSSPAAAPVIKAKGMEPG
jgi:molybdate transport system substrate-binding protein